MGRREASCTKLPSLPAKLTWLVSCANSEEAAEYSHPQSLTRDFCCAGEANRLALTLTRLGTSLYTFSSAMPVMTTFPAVGDTPSTPSAKTAGRFWLSGTALPRDSSVAVSWVSNTMDRVCTSLSEEDAAAGVTCGAPNSGVSGATAGGAAGCTAETAAGAAGATRAAAVVEFCCTRDMRRKVSSGTEGKVGAG